MEGDFISRHHVEPRVQLYVPEEDTFPIPLKYIDVTRTTNTKSGRVARKRIDDYWNVDVNRSLSDSWMDRIHEVHFTERRTSPRIYVLRESQLTPIQATTRPDFCGQKFGLACQRQLRKREKQEWAKSTRKP